MTINPLKTDAYNMFRMPEIEKRNYFEASQAAKPDSVDFTKKKKSKAGKAAALVIAVAAVAGGVYAFRTGKFSALKNKVSEFFHKAPKATKAPITPNVPAVDPKKAQALVQAANGAVDNIAQTAGAVATEAAEQAGKTTAKGTGDGNFVVAAFGVGLIAKAFREAKNNEDDKTIELKALVLEKEKYIKEEELPSIQKEAEEQAEFYSNSTLPAIVSLQKPTQGMRDKMRALEAIYQDLDLDNMTEDFTVLWDGSNVVKFDVRKNSAGAVLLTKNDEKGNKLLTGVFSDSKPIQLDAFEPATGDKIVSRAKFLNDKATGCNYMSHFFKFNTRIGKPAGILTFDALDNAKSMLCTDKYGSLKKVVFMDSQTWDLHGVCLPDEDGKRCAKKFKYEHADELKSVELPPSSDMPKRVYRFNDDVPQSLDMFDEKGKEVLLNVPFELQD